MMCVIQRSITRSSLCVEDDRQTRDESLFAHSSRRHDGGHSRKTKTIADICQANPDGVVGVSVS